MTLIISYLLILKPCQTNFLISYLIEDKVPFIYLFTLEIEASNFPILRVKGDVKWTRFHLLSKHPHVIKCLDHSLPNKF